MKLFKLFILVFSCMFIITPTISFAKMNGNSFSRIDKILSNNSKKIYQMSMEEFINTQLLNIFDLLNKLDFTTLGFSNEVSNSIDSNKPAIMQMLRDFAQPAIEQVSEIDSNFISAGDYFEYVLNQLQHANIDENTIREYFKTANTTELNKLFKNVEVDLQDQSKLLLAKKAVEEYTAKDPQQLLDGGIL